MKKPQGLTLIIKHKWNKHSKMSFLKNCDAILSNKLFEYLI